MTALCKAVFWIYVVLCAASIAIIPLSGRGLLGLQPDPLVGLFAVLLAQPWLSLFEWIAGSESPVSGYVIVIGSILANALILRLLCRYRRN